MNMAIDNQMAAAQLAALVGIEGALQIITAEHRCGSPLPRCTCGANPKAEAGDEGAAHADACPIARCAAYALTVVRELPDESGALVPTEVEEPVSLRDKRHFVITPVIGIAPSPTKDGRLRAHTAAGDWCEGYPGPLLSRLTEWGRVG